MRRVLQCIGGAAVLFMLLAKTTILRAWPNPVFFGLLIIAAAIEIGLLFHPEPKLLRNSAIGFLTVTGLAYALAAICGLIPNMELIESWMWNGLVSPYVPVTLIRSSWSSYDVVPTGPHAVFCLSILCASVLVIVSAIGLGMANRASYWIATVLVCITAVCSLSYIPAFMVTADSQPMIVPIAWGASYVVAFMLATRDETVAPDDRTR